MFLSTASLIASQASCNIFLLIYHRETIKSIVVLTIGIQTFSILQMAAGVVSIVYYYGGKLSDEDRYAKYLGGTRKGGTVPKSISFASFKEKIQQFINLPSNGMDIKIKCGVSLDENSLICVDVDDDDSLRFVMDHSTFVRAYILQDVSPVTTITAIQRKEVVLPPQGDDHYQFYSSSNGISNDNHESEPIPVEDVTEHHEVNCNDISGDLEDIDDRLDTSSLHGLSQTNFDSQVGGINMPTGNRDNHEILETGGWEDPAINILSQPNFDAGDGRIDIQLGNQNDLDMFSQPHTGHRDNGINSSISDHEDTNLHGALNELDEFNVENSATQMEQQIELDMRNQTSAHEPARLVSSDIDIALGKEFLNIDAVRYALDDMAIKTGREYVHVRTSPSKLIRKCRDYRCDWHIHATVMPDSSKFKVEKYVGVHTCTANTVTSNRDHPHVTTRWILSNIQSRIETNPDIKPMEIIEDIENSSGIQISYSKAVKAKRKALELMHKRVKDSNPQPHPDLFRALMKELEQGGTICKLGLNPDGSRFEHLFWAFRACVDALRNHLRPVVYVSMVPTRIGVLMYARGVDGNGGNRLSGQPIDVGYALYVTENEKSWDTFLGWLTKFVLPPPVAEAAEGNSNTPPFTIVTDFNETVTRAVQKLHGIHHFFHTKNLEGFFERKCSSLGMYSYIPQRIFYYPPYATEKCEEYLEEMKSRNEEAYEWLLSSVGSKSHWAIAYSPNKHANVTQINWDDKTYGKDRGAELEKIDRDMILEKLSVAEIVESSREAVANYFSYRRTKVDEATSTTGLTPSQMYDTEFAEGLHPKWRILNSQVVVTGSADGDKYQVTWKDYGSTYTVDLNDDGSTYAVDLKERSCTCGKFQATEYPCYEALFAIHHANLHIKDYMGRWYTLDTYRETYKGSLPPPINYDISQWRTAVEEVPLPPRKRVRRGRPSKPKTK